MNSNADFPYNNSDQENVATLIQNLRRRVSELKRVNRRQQKTIDRFFTFFYATPIPISITRAHDGCYLYVNDAFLDYFGLERQEVVGRSTVEVGFWQEPEERERFVANIREKGHLTRQEDNFRLPGGELRHRILSIAYVEADEESYILGAFLDITDRAQAEQRAQELASALVSAEQQERQRVARLLHDDIQQMLYSLQIDLHILSSQANSELRSQLQLLEKRMLEVIESTRNLSYELSSSAWASKHLADLFERLVSLMADQHNLQIDVDMDDEIVIEQESKRQLVVQTVRELLFNVVKHAGVKEAQLRARIEIGTLIIDVIDKGAGFNIESLNLQSDSPDYGGFGLRNIRERLRLHNGTLLIQSGPGVGTRCTLTVPLAWGTEETGS